MKHLAQVICLPFFLLLTASFLYAVEQAVQIRMFAPSEDLVHHEMKVTLSPQEKRFAAENNVTVPESLLPEFTFALHAGLNPFVHTAGVHMTKINDETHSGYTESFRVRLPNGMNSFVLSYGGTIDHPIEQFGKEQARGYSQTRGMISGEGVYLAGSSFWYPVIGEFFVSFDLRTELPPEWDAVSQGGRTAHNKDPIKTVVRWESPEPQEEIYLIAARFHEYSKSDGRLEAMVFLRTPEKGLAEKYLDATVRYIRMYEKLIGPYLYPKFALVENFWETGFGMPSFTLLGTKVVRFPFIINSSYPHEILHNWWGNSVFPDYRKGNWSEGLTAYLSDHLFKEQQGEGAEYRQTTLQKYADYVSGGRDFPLTGFRSRHSSSSEAIGYGKSLMFFHMLRMELGDKVFIEGIRDFYAKNRFGFAAFDGLERSFAQVSGRDLRNAFDQWVTGTGAPELTAGDMKVKRENDAYLLTGTITQRQPGRVYQLKVPVAVTLQGQDKAYQTVLRMDAKRLDIRIKLPSLPLRIDIDPEFDLFRRLGRDEIPPAITQALGAAKMLAILPSRADAALLQAYRELAYGLRNTGPDEVETKLDTEIIALPDDRAVAIIGYENLFIDKVREALLGYEMDITPEHVRIGQAEFPIKNHSLVLTARNPHRKDMALMFIASDVHGALPGLIRKLPHYHKYSYLGFSGTEPANIAKGRWPVQDSPMTVFIPGEDGRIEKAGMAELRRREALVGHESASSSERMMQTVRFLAGDVLRGRGTGTRELDRAAEYIAEKFREAGLEPAGDNGSYFQEWEDIDDRSHPVKMKNIIGILPGRKQEWSDQSVVIGAHYDHLGVTSGDSGITDGTRIYHGADDNASGVAVLIELAQILGESLTPERNIIFAAFTGEEQGKKGSRHYVASQKRYPAEKCIGMLNLDTVGRLGKNKLLVIGSDSAGEWAHIFRGAGRVAGVEVQTVSEDLDSSDQKSFQDAGVPAVQFFTGPHADYHKPADTAEKIDPEGLTKVASVAQEVLEYLSRRDQPVTSNVQKSEDPVTAIKKERKVSLGIMPDFAFSGQGSRVSGVGQDSPAERAGLREGDIIVGINTMKVNRLKDLSDILKSLHAGDKISIIFLREGQEMTTEAELTERQKN
ncbi:MAG: M20/M25/M40 family metallo-hydrolase [Nitrospirota bacterium]